MVPNSGSDNIRKKIKKYKENIPNREPWNLRHSDWSNEVKQVDDDQFDTPKKTPPS